MEYLCENEFKIIGVKKFKINLANSKSVSERLLFSNPLLKQSFFLRYGEHIKRELEEARNY